MARQIGFHFYTFRVKQKYTSDYETLSSMRGRADALDMLYTAMNAALNSQQDDNAAKRMFCLRQVTQTDRSLLGLLEAGHYGETANIVHSISGQTRHKQRRDEASMLPCFFRLTIPRNSTRATLILQRDNRVPAKQALHDVIERTLKQFDPALTFEITPVVNSATFERLISEGEIQKLRFVRLSIPQDVAERYDRDRDERSGKMEVSIVASRNKAIEMKNTLLDWLQGGDRGLDQYEIPGLESFEFDTVQAEMRVGRKKQIVDFGKRLTQPIIDVSSEVAYDPATGHPTFASLEAVTADLASNEEVISDERT